MLNKRKNQLPEFTEQDILLMFRDLPTLVKLEFTAKTVVNMFRTHRILENKARNKDNPNILT